MFSGTPKRSWLGPGLLMVALAALMALPLAVADDAQGKKRRPPATKIVTRSFAGGSVAFAGTGTGPANPYPSQIIVKGFKKGSRILDVNLTLHSFTSNSPDDVGVMLAHGQTNQGVMADTGGAIPVANITIILDDEAGAALPDVAALVSGNSYKPARYGADWPAPAPSALAVFDGENPNGAWQLYVVDDGFGAQPASFGNGWTLTIKARVPR
jgi:hypothetical protein